MTRLGILAFLALALALSAGRAMAQADAGPAGSCGLLAKAAPADMTVDAVRPLDGGACRLEGRIDADVGVVLLLPDAKAWNGKLLTAGVGGQAGQVNEVEMRRALGRGYAAASTDAGHKVADTHWLLKSPRRAANYAWRANHLLAIDAKAVVRAFYGAPLRRSIFVGCSGGGRQALTEVQRFPEDYDAVIAGAPGPKTPEMSARRMWEMVQHTRFTGVLQQADWTRIAAEAVRRCDALDGLSDGVIEDPRRCTFRPRDMACAHAAEAGCLTPDQVALAERVYAPLVDENGRRIDDGLLPGVPVSPALVPEPFTPGPAYLASVLFGDGVHGDPQWDARQFRLADDLPAIDRLMDLHADDPDIRKFTARGGKLILFQGWADGLVSALPTVDYYEAVRAKLGAEAADGAVRLFMIPGMGHCVGGDATDRFGGVGKDGLPRDPGHDMLSALELWADGGPAPERIVAAKMEGEAVVRTRPLCAYPKQARYAGGDANDAASFACAAPPRSIGR